MSIIPHAAKVLLRAHAEVHIFLYVPKCVSYRSICRKCGDNPAAHTCYANMCYIDEIKNDIRNTLSKRNYYLNV